MGSGKDLSKVEWFVKVNGVFFFSGTVGSGVQRDVKTFLRICLSLRRLG